MTVTINGQPHGISGSTLTYETIARIVQHAQPTVTYRFRHTNIGGELSPGDVVGVSEGLVISAVDTSAA